VERGAHGIARSGYAEYARLPFSHVDSEEHRAFAREVAEKMMVLLKNDEHILPLRNVKTMAMIGPNAESLIAPEGNYNGVPSNPVLPLDGIEREFASTRVLYAQGAPLCGRCFAAGAAHCAACRGEILRQRDLHWRAGADAR
jgi:beta-glucosidase-like glycosyl hydrolase